MSSSTSLNAPITTVNKNNSITNIKDITVGRNLSTSSIENNSYTTLNAKSSPVFSNACNRSLIQFNVYNQLQQLQQQNFQTISTPSSPLNTGFSPNTVLKNADDDIFQTTTPEIKSPKTNLIDMVRLSSAGSREFNKSTKKESLKEQKKNYRCEKKRATNEILSTLADPNVMMISDWLKVRGSLKSWVKLWCVLKPGLLLLYKSTKNKPRPKDGAKALKSNENVETSMITQSSHWVATCLLSSCEVMERPSKKDGFCFKLFHPLDQSIWATKGPKGENIGALTLPLPNSYLICRASSEAAGRCWIDALELALHCTGLLLRSMTNKEANLADLQTRQGAEGRESSGPYAVCENDFDPSLELDDKEVLKFESEEEEEEEDEEDECSKLKKGKSKISSEFKRKTDHNSPPVESPYIENVVEELGQTGSACQTEEVADENRSIIWTLVKQVRPGMDLSKVALPTFILEPRSFLDKLSDYYYHADLLSEAVCLEDPYSRMKMVVKWYLSGFYKKPKGLKKPYNPILGETFRCYWKHPKTSSRTFYIAEQISHHPPVSAFYVTNRQDGFSITGSILAKSKFYGNSLSAFLDGVCRLVLLSRGEEYTITMPYAHCKGILIGTLTMEFGGEVSIQCEKTGYKTELEFKLKPFLGSDEASNRVAGKIKLGEETLASIEGHWDQETYIRDKKTQNSYLFWNPNTDVKSARLKRHTISPECQFDFESEKLWKHVSEAITKGDQRAATDEKCLLEEEQRKNARERKARMLEWTPNLFERNLITGDWVYKFADWRPWDPLNDVLQFEKDFVISTKTNHQTPIVHTTSITSMEDNPLSPKISGNHSRNPSMDCAVRMQRMKIRSINIPSGTEGSPLGDNNADDADSGSSSSAQVDEVEKYEKKQNVTIDCLLDLQKEMNEKVNHVQHQLTVLHSKLSASRDNHFHKTIAIVIATIIMHYLILSLFK